MDSRSASFGCTGSEKRENYKSIPNFTGIFLFSVSIFVFICLAHILDVRSARYGCGGLDEREKYKISFNFIGICLVFCF